MLTKIHIQNYRVFTDFTLEFSAGLNVIVGDNDTGKSTLLEAVNLALTSRLRGRLLASELSTAPLQPRRGGELHHSGRGRQEPGASGDRD